MGINYVYLIRFLSKDVFIIFCLSDIVFILRSEHIRIFKFGILTIYG